MMDRRAFLSSVAALSLARVDGLLPHPVPRAKRAIHICICGGLSHIDTFDYKPELINWHGRAMPADRRPDAFFGKVGLLRRPDWAFERRGDSGLWVSELLPHLGRVADELTVIRSMVADTTNHVPAKSQENTGFQRAGFPTLGSWLSYGLGSAAKDLPAYVVIPDVRGMPAGGPMNWTSGFLPAEHGGVVLRSGGVPVADLFPGRAMEPKVEIGTREMLRVLNEGYRGHRGGGRVAYDRERAYDLAARMQLSLPEATRLADEPEETRRLYGVLDPACTDFARSCLLGRRLLERGVRFVQLFVGGSFGSPRINWDGHEDMVRNHEREAPRIDRPVAGLLADLSRRGMLEDTLVLFTTEFGRSPYTQSKGDVVGRGRDHNEKGFSIWLAGASLKPGIAYGETDELGYRAVSQPVPWPDLHATILHLFGLDHERLTFYHDGMARRLTNVSGKVLHGILA